MQKRWWLLAIVCIVGILLFLSKCATSRHGTTSFAKGIVLQKEVAIANNEKYPVKVAQLASEGTLHTVTYKRQPRRIVAVWQNSVETLLALGAGDAIIAAIGVPDAKYISPEYRDAYEKIPYKSMQLPDKESLLYNEPDLLVGWWSTFSNHVFGPTDFWEARGIHTYIARSSSAQYRNATDLLAGEYQYIKDIGAIVGKESEAQRLVDNVEQYIHRVSIASEAQQSQVTALVVEPMGKELHIYGQQTLAGTIVTRLGGHLLAPNGTSIGNEELIGLNPEVLFVVVTESNYNQADSIVQRLYDNPALQSLQAVQHRRIYVLPLYTIYSPGIRVKDGVTIVAEGLYPHIDKGGMP